MKTGIVTLGPWRYSGPPRLSEALQTEREKLVGEILELRDKALNAVPDWYAGGPKPTPEQEAVIRACVARMADRKARLAEFDARIAEIDAERG